MAHIKKTKETQTERTPTGVITTRKDIIDGKVQWTQIGYTSIVKNADGKEKIDGPFGQELL